MPNKELQDTDLMPLGKFKGKLQMKDVPADYLFWFWNQDGKKQDRQCPVAAYIRRCLTALKAEYQDGIW